MASTEKKLGELMFFLNLLEENYFKDPDFDYFLSRSLVHQDQFYGS